MAAVMSPANTFSHRAPWWLPGGHLQTIVPSLFARATTGAPPEFRRERWTTPDQDFVWNGTANNKFEARHLGIAETRPLGGGFQKGKGGKKGPPPG